MIENSGRAHPRNEMLSLLQGVSIWFVMISAFANVAMLLDPYLGSFEARLHHADVCPEPCDARVLTWDGIREEGFLWLDLGGPESEGKLTGTGRDRVISLQAVSSRQWFPSSFKGLLPLGFGLLSGLLLLLMSVYRNFVGIICGVSIAALSIWWVTMGPDPMGTLRLMFGLGLAGCFSVPVWAGAQWVWLRIQPQPAH